MLKPRIEVHNVNGVFVAEFWDCLRLDPGAVQEVRGHYEQHLRGGGRPELVIDPSFGSVRGVVAIERAGERIWSKEIATGEEHMCHSLANMEHHHFKYEQHRRPGDVHIHFFGAAALSFGEGVHLEEGDVMMLAFEGFGRALRNPTAKVPVSRPICRWVK